VPNLQPIEKIIDFMRHRLETLVFTGKNHDTEKSEKMQLIYMTDLSKVIISAGVFPQLKR
jgi:hypothetical protein